MPRQDDISSTERLLNVIRNTNPVKVAPVPKPAAPKRPRTSAAFRIFGKSALSVGVDITEDAIHLVKIDNRNRRKPSILDHKSITLLSDPTKSKGRKAGLLGKALTDFCPASPPPRIWTTVSLEESDIRFLRIPRVPGTKLENTIFWTLQKEAPFEKEKTLLDFRVLGNTTDKGVPKTEVLVCTASREHVEALQALFRNAGFELSGVIAPPFVFQNYVKAGWCHADESLVCNLLIDHNWSRIDIVRPNGDLIVSRGIKAGIASMIESIRNEGPRPPETGERTLDGPGEMTTVLELSVFDAFEAEQVLQILNTDVPAASYNAGTVLKDDDVFNMVLPALERLVRQVERTLEHVGLRYSDGPITRLFFSGPITAYPRIVTYMAGQLDLPAKTVDPFSSVPPDLSRPETASTRALHIASAGLALSEIVDPPNFLHTHREQHHHRRTRMLRCAVFCCFLIAAGLIWGHHISQQHRIRALGETLRQFNETGGASGDIQDRTSLLVAVSKVNLKNRRYRALSKKYLPAALIGEVTGLAPEEILFFRIEGRNAEAQTDSPGGKARETGNYGMTTVVDGAVYGSSATVETTLARYLLLLKQSPLIHQVSLEEKSYQQINSQQVLRFFLSLEGA